MSTTAPTSDDAPEKRFVSVEGFSRAIGVSRSTGYTLLDSGQVRSVRFGARRLIPTAELDRFADELTAQAQ
jgi:excisionase family DNA binding protein